MQKRISMINVPLLAGSALSIAIHVTALYSKSLYRPSEPRMESGRTVLQLTLLPSPESRSAAPETRTAPAAPPLPPLLAALPSAEGLQPDAPAPSAGLTHPEPVPDDMAIDSPEQEASLLEDKGVITEASAASSIQPVYPRISRQRGEEGVVTLSIEVRSSGQAGRIELIQSSGYRRLDEAACRAAREASFVPARQLGRDIDSITELSFTFRLTDD